MGSAKVSRRAFLSLATAVPLVAACTAGEDTSPTTPPPPTPTPTEDSANEDLRLRVAEAETLLIARYDATIAAHPSLTASLTLISEQHREHLQALAPIDVPTPGDVGPIPDDSAAAVAESSPPNAPLPMSAPPPAQKPPSSNSPDCSPSSPLRRQATPRRSRPRRWHHRERVTVVGTPGRDRR